MTAGFSGRWHVVLLLLTGCLGGTAHAQLDLSGTWQQKFHEDWPERGAGPEIGEYFGLPINAEARSRAEAWHPEQFSLPDYICRPHPADYASQGPGALRIVNEIDRQTQRVVALHTIIQWMNTQRTIYVDGRGHPSKNAPHTWQGFSTGKWEADILVVTTTHLKEGYVRRNGVPRSDRATLTEFWVRHGDTLTLISSVDDPVYLSEPVVRSRNWVFNPNVRIGPYPCSVRVHIERPLGFVAHFLPGRNDLLAEFAAKNRLPASIAGGGAQTMYPEFIEVLNAAR